MEKAQAAGDSGKADQNGSLKEMEDSSGEALSVEAKPEITYEDFAKLQFQVGEIISCEAVKKSKKLLVSQPSLANRISGFSVTLPPLW